MPSFTNPTPNHRFNATSEKRALGRHFTKRGVPRSKPGKLLLCSWNIANLGEQKRSAAALDVLAYILARFDLIALQEVKADWGHLKTLMKELGSSFDFVMSDTAGNSERLAYIYRKSRVKPRQLFGELALRPREYPKRTVKVRYEQGGQQKVDTFRNLRFVPFDRNPFIGSFDAKGFDLTLVNVHLYFGKFGNSTNPAHRAKYARRVLEIYALSRWADRSHQRRTVYDKDIVLLGDMNVPAMTPEDSAYDALTDFGWQPLDHGTQTGGATNIRNTKTYDQVVFAPGGASRRIVQSNVFDFDNAVFGSLWDRLKVGRSDKQASTLFNKHLQFHLSDHRPVWIELDAS